MTRLSLLNTETAPASTQAALKQAIKNSGFLPNLLALLANAPVALQAYQDMSSLNAQGSLDLKEREVVQLVAGTLHGCTFCVAGHTALATNKAKLNPEYIEALRQQHYDQISDTRLRALALFAEQVILTRGKVSDGALQAFFKVGYEDQQALEVIVGIGLATICNFANNLAHTPLNDQLEAYQWATH